MLEKTKKFLSSKNFVWLIISLFIVQAAWFAVSIRHEVPADEVHHYQLINYYADRPLSAGPVIADQQDHFVLGDIERTPNYLYHYLLSFPMKIIKHFFSGMPEQLILMRLVNIVFGVLSLLVIYKIYRLLTASRLAANIGLGITSMTGAFLWLSAAVNYDNLGILLFLVTIYAGLSFIKSLSIRHLLIVLVSSAATVLVKVTFAPVLLVFILTLAVVFVRSPNRKKWLTAARKELKTHKLAILALATLLIICTGLFVERIGQNLIEHKAITPACTNLHSLEQCRENKIYRRNLDQKDALQKFHESGQQLQYSPLGFAGGWLDQMYEGLYFYFGQSNIVGSDNVANLATVFGVVLLMLLILYRQNLPSLSMEQKITAGITIFYILMLYIFNLNSYLNSGAMYGFQGRYLLPIMPFIYLFMVLAMVRLFSVMYKKKHRLGLAALSVLTIVVIFHHLPLLTFYRGTDDTWYFPQTQKANSRLQSILDKTKLAKEGSLTYDQEWTSQ